MKTDTIKNQNNEPLAAPKTRKRVEVVGPSGAGRYRLPPLDNNRVNEVFVTHDRFRAFLRSA